LKGFATFLRQTMAEVSGAGIRAAGSTKNNCELSGEQRMKLPIRNLVRLTFLAAVLTLCSVAASAQSSGTVTITGNVQNSYSIRWWSYTNVNSVSGANAPNTQNTPLAFTMNLGDVSATGNPNAYVGGKVKMILRSNAAYGLKAQVTSSSGFAAPGGDDISLADVGFGMANKANSGTLVVGDPAANSNFQGAFGNDPSTATKDVDGVPAFATTLNDVSAAATDVLQGPRISKKGGIDSPNNGMLVDAIFAVAPQFFNPLASFSATVTFTISTP
jgi:hypothetical protein